MIKYPQLICQQGDSIPSPRFNVELQKVLLIFLKKKGVLNQLQLEQCIHKLEESAC